MTRFYRQNAAAVALTLIAAAEAFAKTVELEPNLRVFCPNLQCYLSPDRQTHNFYELDSQKPLALAILDHIGRNPDFAQNRISDLLDKTQSLEMLGEQLLKTADVFSPKNPFKAIPQAIGFQQANCGFWETAFFLDLLDPFEAEIVSFIFGSKKETISKADIQVLMTPTQSVYREEQLALQKIREKKRKGEPKAQLRALLEAHAKRYWWIQNDYQKTQRLQPADFEQRLDEPDYRDSLKEIEILKQALFQKYGLSESAKTRLDQFSKLAFLRDLRKKFNQVANYYLIHFFHQIAEKNGVPVSLADFVVPFEEAERFIRKDPVLLEELEQRTRQGVWILIRSTEKNGFYEIQTKNARKLFEKMEKEFSGGTLLYGNPASLGRAIGPARIVLRQSDFGKFKAGDVLVTGMTRPEFVPLMKKACAIVTDEGGITSHAAIVSRELGKPCVIGTQTATKSFKDNDVLEVNANHGFVRKLEDSA